MAGVKNSGNKGQDMESSSLLSADRRSIRRSSGTERDTTLPKAVYFVCRGKRGKRRRREIVSNADTWTVALMSNRI